MSTEMKNKLMKIIEEYRAEAREQKDVKRLMHTAYADGIRRAITEIERATKNEIHG